MHKYIAAVLVTLLTVTSYADGTMPVATGVTDAATTLFQGAGVLGLAIMAWAIGRKVVFKGIGR